MDRVNRAPKRPVNVALSWIDPENNFTRRGLRRSMLRQISHAPDLEWPRWRALQAMAKAILNETESPTMTDLPPLEYNQTKRIDHRLVLRRH